MVNVSDQVQPGLIGAIFGWQGPSDNNPFGMPQYYANNLVAGGDACSRSPTARSTRTRAGRCASSSAHRAPPRNTPGLSEKQRFGVVTGPGVDGNPDSKAKNFVSRQL